MRPLLQPMLDRWQRTAFGRQSGGADPEELASAASALLGDGILDRPTLGRALRERWPDGERHRAGALRAGPAAGGASAARTARGAGAARRRSCSRWRGSGRRQAARPARPRPVRTSPVRTRPVRTRPNTTRPASARPARVRSAIWCCATSRRSAPRPRPTRPRGAASPACARSWRRSDRGCGSSWTTAAASCSTCPTHPGPTRTCRRRHGSFRCSTTSSSGTPTAPGSSRTRARTHLVVEPALTVDGFVRGVWRIDGGTLAVRLFAPLSATEEVEVIAEGAALLRFAAADTGPHDVRLTVA